MDLFLFEIKRLDGINSLPSVEWRVSICYIHLWKYCKLSQDGDDSFSTQFIKYVKFYIHQSTNKMEYIISFFFFFFFKKKTLFFLPSYLFLRHKSVYRQVERMKKNE